MSSGVCRSCKHESSCTYPRNQTIVQCEEYEYAEPRSRSGDKPSATCCESSDTKGEVAAAAS